eukprot:2613688-Alexandrium_andersonii.AAC.1
MIRFALLWLSSGLPCMSTGLAGAIAWGKHGRCWSLQVLMCSTSRAFCFVANSEPRTVPQDQLDTSSGA